MKDTFVRFSARQRIEHFSVMFLFIALAVTGFPQKFSDAGWAQWMVHAMGGVEGTTASRGSSFRSSPSSI
jgi:cytochrome b subunit of formate dehydrogenase